MKFDIYCTKPITDEDGNVTGIIKNILVYDNEASILIDGISRLSVKFESDETKSIEQYTTELSMENVSRLSLTEFYAKISGHDDFTVIENEWYDKISFKDAYDHWAYRDISLRELRSGLLFKNHALVRERMEEWITSIQTERKIDATDERCLNCPVLQTCKGKHLQTCDVAYSDHIPFLAVFVEVFTGWLPYKIVAQDYELPPDRIDLWGQGVKTNVKNTNS